MFTGIIKYTGSVWSVRGSPSGVRLTVAAGLVAEGTALGASVAVNGVCLTLAAIDQTRLSFDVIPETLRRTNLGGLRPGGRVNLEQSLCVGDPLDGHFVQGHVDGRAAVIRVESRAERIVWLRPEANLMRYVVPKGSIALDGVSLTIAQIEGDSFAIALIPTTLERTTLGDLEVGHEVNVETDILARTVVHTLVGMMAAGGGGESVQSVGLRRHPATTPDAASGITLDFLKAHGYR